MAQMRGVVFVKPLGGRAPPGSAESGGQEPYNLHPDFLQALALQRVWEAELKEGSVHHCQQSELIVFLYHQSQDSPPLPPLPQDI